MLRGSVLGLALLVNLPVLWAALGTQTVPVDAALIRLLITLPVVAVLLGGVRLAMSSKDQTDDAADPPVQR